MVKEEETELFFQASSPLNENNPRPRKPDKS
jgi:hypothetical protein